MEPADNTREEGEMSSGDADDGVIFYAVLQLNITKGASDGSLVVQQLLDIVYKELDQYSISNRIVPRTDAVQCVKFGTLGSSDCALVELAAAVHYPACVNLTKAPLTEKRAKREHVAEGEMVMHVIHLVIYRWPQEKSPESTPVFWSEHLHRPPPEQILSVLSNFTAISSICSSMDLGEKE